MGAGVFLLLTGCPDSTTEDDGGDPIASDAIGGKDVNQFVGCQTDQDCVGPLGALSACQVAKCDEVSLNCKAVNAENGTQCDDDNLCSTGDQCQNGACSGVSDNQCDDGNPCTNDQCNPATGACEGIPNKANCNDNNKCTINDQCSDGKCTGLGSELCECEIEADCAKHEDGDLCNGTLTCEANQCVPKAGTEVACTDEDAGPCQENRCDPADGQCKLQPKADGVQCNDGSACTKEDQCDGGACEGVAVVCDDENECTDDSCDLASGCVFANNTVGCDDADLCTVDDQCSEGKCSGTKNPDCQCSSDADCSPFEDGNLCNGTLKCTETGSCEVDEATAVDCSEEAAAAPPCTQVACEKTTGECKSSPALGGSACDDGSACTQNDACKQGVCAGAEIPCADENECTDDGCDPASGCTFTPNSAACDDGNDCTDNDVCADGTCAGAGECTCTDTSDCVQFEDGDLCNGTLECSAGACTLAPGTVVVCEADGQDPCTTSTCIADTGSCKALPVADGTACDDGTLCTEDDFCTAGTCQGKALVCDDGNLCTDNACDPGIGCVVTFNDAPCDDGNECTDNDGCTLGQCGGAPVEGCSCETDADCAELDDGDPCNGTLVCASSKCVVKADSAVVCAPDQDSPCSVNACNPATGACEMTPATDGKPCEDSDACTTGEACTAGVCGGGESAVCDDGNPCTDDSCATDFGCVAEPNTELCDDGDPCTVGDSCADGLCQPGADNVCGDLCEAQWTLTCGSFDTWGTDNFGATNVVTDYSCNSFDYPGPEYTYLFQAPYDGKMSVTLTNETGPTDVLVLEQTSLGCDPKACTSYGFALTEAEMTAGTTYYLVVDGFLDQVGDYTIEIDCAPATEVDCTDGLDEDGDELTDCDDPDCSADEACAAPQCVAFWPLGCGEEDVWTNYWFVTESFDSYSACGNPWSYPAPEFAYIFDSPVTGEVTVTLSDETAETDVIVLTAGPDGECLADACVDYGLSAVTFDAVAGQTYYLIVDGFNGALGSYRINVTCPLEVETSCNDGVDNDADEATDCADEDCAGQAICAADCNPLKPLEVACGGTWSTTNDDAQQSKATLTTYSCSADEYTGPEVAATFVAPFDGTVTVTLDDESAETDILVVSDAQGLCDPANCVATGFDEATFEAVAGTTYYLVVDGYDGAVGSFTLALDCTAATELSCDDGVDDDGDGSIDCLDSDCFGASDACQPACVPDTAAAAELLCPIDNDFYSNDDTGSTNVITGYSCAPYTYSGPEYVYTYVATANGEITVTLDDESAETDVLVLEDQGLGCNPASCIATGLSSATFDAVDGNTYYIVVDGFLGAAGTYSLDFTCE